MKIMKRIAILLGRLIALLIVVALVLSIAGGARLNQKVEIRPEAIDVPAADAALARGEHLVNVACRSCHGADLTGTPLLEDPAIGTIYASNLTGLSETHSDAELMLAIRHGVDSDGRRLMIMPSESFIHFSAEDLGAVIAYLKTVPAAGDQRSQPRLGLMGRILLATGMFGDVFPAEYIDHEMAFPAMPAVGANREYGAYLAAFCSSCHGANLTGAQPSDPTSPPAPNLTPSGRLRNWKEAEFIETMRLGLTPDGRRLDPMFMPWDSFGKFDDAELQALWIYLQSLP
jgi:mono/diheme cytochrome c family protein